MSAPTGMESETELVARAVRELAQRTRFPVAFGGLIDEGVVSVTSIVGNRTHSLDGLRVRPERGLGGRAMIELRPRMTNDYGSSQQITHDYDVFVLGEGLRTLLALPIVVSGRPRGVLYAGAWDRTPEGGVTTAPAMQVAQSVADELRIRDEVARRLRAVDPTADSVATPQREELRESFAELRSIAAAVDDPGLRERIAQVEHRLVALAGDSVTTATAPVPTVHLSRRETDVLACAALGATNAEIALQLGLREGTVKAYLGTAMSKLDASTRHAAVAKARRFGLLP
ncbi:LuxR C-terminal-related transcriptional regulator [Microbacterium hydrocarbonoxydans]|uniref:LuxR C-terminal-related transcriptional regulator n=1 Tax=Microbacterium hydrocarbonoxydans TaxID=273678 RepID=UPI002041EF3B|nr:LuxR C-terminal-related transcriptional regulator [Microbacterium hydrocarbonoxydans]MCM3780097.1 LuxR C-terminal-related transcriptional regulator [Microbacterium hydrocarbonoxydans]